MRAIKDTCQNPNKTTRNETKPEVSVLAGAPPAFFVSRREKKMKNFLKSEVCPICRAIVIVKKSGKLSAKLLKSLALANHVKTLHGIN